MVNKSIGCKRSVAVSPFFCVLKPLFRTLGISKQWWWAVVWPVCVASDAIRIYRASIFPRWLDMGRLMISPLATWETG